MYNTLPIQEFQTCNNSPTPRVTEPSGLVNCKKNHGGLFRLPLIYYIHKWKLILAPRREFVSCRTTAVPITRVTCSSRRWAHGELLYYHNIILLYSIFIRSYRFIVDWIFKAISSWHGSPPPSGVYNTHRGVYEF